MCEGCVIDEKLSQRTYDKIEAFVEKWPNSSYGPGHIVLDDCNLGDGHLDFCIDKLNNYCPDDYSCEHSWEELTDTWAFLRDLRAIPEDDR